MESWHRIGRLVAAVLAELAPHYPAVASLNDARRRGERTRRERERKASVLEGMPRY